MLHQQGCETRPGTSAERVEDEETLQTGALISQFADSVQNKIDNFLSDGVVASRVVVGSIFFSSDQLLRVKQLTVSSGSYLVNNSWLKVDENSSRYMLAGTSFAEEGVERVVTTSDRLVAWHLT